MKIFEKKPDIGRDFNHLAIALSMSPTSTTNSLIDILENCLKDPAYKETAIYNLVYFATTETTIKQCLESIIYTSDKKHVNIKPLCEEVFNQEKTSFLPLNTNL